MITNGGDQKKKKNVNKTAIHKITEYFGQPPKRFVRQLQIT